MQTQLFAETDCNTEINTAVFLQVFVDIMQGRGIFVTEHMKSQSRSTGRYFTFFQLLCAKQNKTKQCAPGLLNTYASRICTFFG